MTEHQTFLDFDEADRAWQEILEGKFGPRAGDMRYRAEGRGCPGTDLRRAYDKVCKARQAWIQSRRAS